MSKRRASTIASDPEKLQTQINETMQDLFEELVKCTNISEDEINVFFDLILIILGEEQMTETSVGMIIDRIVAIFKQCDVQTDRLEFTANRLIDLVREFFRITFSVKRMIEDQTTKNVKSILLSRPRTKDPTSIRGGLQAFPTRFGTIIGTRPDFTESVSDFTESSRSRGSSIESSILDLPRGPLSVRFESNLERISPPKRSVRERFLKAVTPITALPLPSLVTVPRSVRPRRRRRRKSRSPKRTSQKKIKKKKLTVADLRKKASKKKIPGRSKMNKQQLQRALK